MRLKTTSYFVNLTNSIKKTKDEKSRWKTSWYIINIEKERRSNQEKLKLPAGVVILGCLYMPKLKRLINL